MVGRGLFFTIPQGFTLHGPFFSIVAKDKALVCYRLLGSVIPDRSIGHSVHYTEDCTDPPRERAYSSGERPGSSNPGYTWRIKPKNKQDYSVIHPAPRPSADDDRGHGGAASVLHHRWVFDRWPRQGGPTLLGKVYPGCIPSWMRSILGALYPSPSPVRSRHSIPCYGLSEVTLLGRFLCDTP